LEEISVCAKFAHTAADGKTYNTKFYNLDAIISVGYRVNSIRATQFTIFFEKKSILTFCDKTGMYIYLCSDFAFFFRL